MQWILAAAEYKMAKHTRLWLGLIVLFGLALRLVNLENRGIQYDDAFSIFLSGRSLFEITTGTAADTMPPLFYYLLHFWLFVNQSIAWIRLLGIIMSLGSIVGIHYLVRLLTGEKEGLFAAFLVAVSPLQYYHAQDVRMYSLLAVFQLGYAIFFVKTWLGKEIPSRRNWIGLIFCGAGAMYTHNLAIIALGVPNVLLLFQKNWKLLKRLLIAQAGIGLLFLPWLFYLPGQLAKVQKAFWTPVPGLLEVIQALVMATTGLPIPEDWLPVALLLSILALLLICFSLILSKKDWGLAYIGLLIVFPPFIQFILSYITRPVFVPRSFIFSTMAYLVLAGVVAGRAKSKLLTGMILVTLVLGAAVGIPAQATYDRFPRSPFKIATEFLAIAANPDDQIVHDNKLSHFPMLYYQNTLRQEFLRDEPGSPNDTLAFETQKALDIFPLTNLETVLSKNGKIFFVTFDQTLQEYAIAGKLHPVVEEISRKYNLLQTIKFEDLNVMLFGQ